MLEVRQLTVAYGGVTAVRGVDLDVEAGEVVTILGRNGAGKSSLLNAIAGLVRRHGSIRFDGEEISDWPAHRIARAGLVLVPERRRLFPGMTVEENLRLGLRAPGGGDWTSHAAVVFDLFPILEQRLGQRAGSLSGGEQQMLTIARALLTKPRLICADEPSLGLAPKAIEAVFGAFRRLNTDHGVTILLSEQRANTTRDLADHVYEVSRGSARLVGRAHDFARAYLGGEHALFARPEPVWPRVGSAR